MAPEYAFFQRQIMVLGTALVPMTRQVMREIPSAESAGPRGKLSEKQPIFRINDICRCENIEKSRVRGRCALSGTFASIEPYLCRRSSVNRSALKRDVVRKDCLFCDFGTIPLPKKPSVQNSRMDKGLTPAVFQRVEIALTAMLKTKPDHLNAVLLTCL